MTFGDVVASVRAALRQGATLGAGALSLACEVQHVKNCPNKEQST